jgi:LysR family glycine cleavage system transcriptional activator
MVEDDLRSGRLVAPFTRQVATQGAYYLASPEEGPKAARVVAFEKWLLDEAMKDEERMLAGMPADAQSSSEPA